MREPELSFGRRRPVNISAKLIIGLVASCAVLVGCASDDDSVSNADWFSFDLGPLGPRNDAVVAAVDLDVLVVGGNNFFCPPTADCASPEIAPLIDGAVFSTETLEWRPVADAPFGIDRAEAATIGTAVYAITQCEKHPSCPRGRAMVRYDLGSDEWSTLAAVPGMGYHQLVPVDGELYAISITDETLEPDHRYKAESDTWVALESAPMPPAFDRFAVDVAGRLILYGSPIDGEERDKFVASYDPANDAWTELSRAPSGGWQVFDVDDSIVLNPHFGSEPGGLHDVSTDTWSPLPTPPSSDRWRGDIAGVIGDGHASYESADGWMLDLRNGEWIEVGPTDAAPSGASVATVGDALFVAGGHHWTDDEVRVDGGAFLWRPPEL